MTSRRSLLKSAALLPLAAVSAKAVPAAIAPPLAGHFTHEKVRLWFQSSEATRATVRYWPVAGREEDARAIAAVPLDAAGGLCAIVDVEGLQAATSYRYRVSFENAASGAIGSFRTAPAPGAPPGDFRLYVGSCAYTEAYTRGGNPYGANFQIFDTMAARMGSDALPHFMLWLGDNLYLRGPSTTFGAVAEYSSAAHMELRYKDVRSQFQLRNLFAATHHYATWDDHDYGANNDDKTFALKDDSLRLFRAYWPNPPMGSPELPGVWCRFSHQDADFFLLDNRFYRDGEKSPASPGKAMFGPAQMAWLRAGLATSKATFKIVAAGTQFLSHGKNGEASGWHSYPGERDAFFAWLEAHPVPGLVLLSGDRHNTQLFREGGLHEFSCSPLTSKVSPLTATERSNPRLQSDCAVETQNFGTLEFSGSGAGRKVTGRCFDANGRLLWTRVLASAG